MVTTEKVYCSEKTLTWSGRERGYVCTKSATGDDGVCGLHRNVRRRKVERDERWRRTVERMERDYAQKRYVEAWRKQHPIQTYSAPIVCPLCGKAIRVVLASGIETDDELTARLLPDMMEQHHQSHGSAWLDYTRLGTSAEAGGDGDLEAGDHA